MSDDASLTDFVGGGGDEDDGENDGGDEGGEAVEEEERVSVDEENDEPSNTEPAEKPTYTYTSTPDGAECDACGEMVEERWHAGEGGVAEDPDLSPDALVCPDCKEW